MSRPTVDVVIPFAGSPEDRAAVLDRLRALETCDGDTVVLVDNGPKAPPPAPDVLHAPDRGTSYFARNRGAERGRAEWILFLDGDVLFEPDLLDRLFAQPVGERVGIIAGGVRDEEAADPAALPLAARYAALRAPMSQENTLRHEGWAYAQTAHAAFRRAAFEQVGGFAEAPRSGGDADLCFRVRAAGWDLAYRPEAMVTHVNRTTLRALLRQRLRHGSGSAWLNRRHPGSQPASVPAALVRSQGITLLRHLRRGRRRQAALALVDVLVYGALLCGRILPNEVEPR